MSNEVYNQIAEDIIAHQQAIIGPIAVERAQHVPGMAVDWPNHKVTITGLGSKVVDDLVAHYKELFGQISVEVCKEAARQHITQLPPDNIPISLL